MTRGPTPRRTQRRRQWLRPGREGVQAARRQASLAGVQPRQMGSVTRQPDQRSGRVGHAPVRTQGVEAASVGKRAQAGAAPPPITMPAFPIPAGLRGAGTRLGGPIAAPANDRARR
ncbi:MAG: hypothetical protein NVSMB18_08430 [Acetobacteraceae bacterium]